jgi:hypothetical protein
MKAIKIGLAIVVIGAIIFFVIKWLATTNEVDEIPASENTSTKLIDDKIDSIGTLQNNEFNKDIYNEIKYLIDDRYQPHPPQYPFGRLGDTQLENDQQKDILSRNLYTAYANKFLKQAFYVFNDKSWNSEDLTFIRSEYRLLRESRYLERGSTVDNNFGDVKRIFDKYDEINRFIYSCNSFSYAEEPSLNDKFPVEIVSSKLDQVKTYRNTGLGNRYLNNCERLHNELNAIPKNLFQKHVQYLDHKINLWRGMYNQYSSQRAYAENLYTPLKNEIDILDNGLYEIPDLSYSEASRLIDKLNADADDAYNYFSRKQKYKKP